MSHNEGEETMRNQLLVCSSIMFAILFIFQITPQAKEQVIDYTRCIAGTCEQHSEAEDFSTMSCRARGIGWSNNDFKPLETFAILNRCLLGIKNGKWTMDCFLKYVDQDGDHLVIHSGKVYGGTGKWKGVTGEIQSKWIRRVTSLPTGNFANCSHVTGTFEMPE